uniref:Calcineurin-like phosphoesterase domain-containing protein n=1 Tax=candidate division WWE3 bacterium TaxID=2053526 RepID=A0A7C4TJ04_UNCKA
MKGYPENQEKKVLRPHRPSVLKGFVAVIILSAFVLSVSFSVKYLSSLDISTMSALLSKVGIKNSKIEEVAGDFIQRVGDSGIENGHELNIYSSESDPLTQGKNVIDEDIAATSTRRSDSGIEDSEVLRIGILADLHITAKDKDYEDNRAALLSSFGKVKDLGIDQTLILGDLTNYGDLPSLELVRSLLQNSNLQYRVLPGDHDLADSVGPANFVKIFGKSNDSFVVNGYKFVMFDNSANFTPISQNQLDWLAQELEDADFVFLSQPIYTQGLVLFSNVHMGSTLSSPESPDLLTKQAQVKAQRDTILSMIRNSNVKAVIAGDHHKSSMVEDKEKPGLRHYVVGAIGGNVGEYSQKSLQSQRFSVLELFSDGTFKLGDVTL